MKWIRKEYAPDVTRQKMDVDHHFKDDDNLSITDEGGQNTKDNGIIQIFHSSMDSTLSPVKSEDIPIIKINKKKMDKNKFKNLIGDKFQEWILDSKQIQNKYFLKNELEKNEDVEILLFEDFNTTGIKGGPLPHDIKMSDGSRNDYFAFIWDVGATEDKGEDKGGSIGIGRLTFALSSKINTFFVLTKQNFKNYKDTYFTGLAKLGQSKSNSYLDPIARFGVDGNDYGIPGIPCPIKNETDIDIIKKIFKLERKENEPGSSMIVPYPIEDLTYENIILNFIKRYRVGFYLNHFKVFVGETCISRDTIKDVIKKYIPSEYSNYCSYFDFLDFCTEIEKNKSHYKVSFDTENPAKVKKENIKEEDISKITSSLQANEVIGLRIPVIINEKIDSGHDNEEVPKKSFVDVYLQKCEMGSGKQDTLRRVMSVSGVRYFEGKDFNALINIQDNPAQKMFRKLETPNHKYFSNYSQEFESHYGKYRNQLNLVQKAPENLKTLFEEIDSKLDSDAADDFFDFGKGSESGKSKSRKSGTGKETEFNVPDTLFANPKAYEVKKIIKKDLMGFRIYNTDFKEQCKKTIENIKLFLKENEGNDKFTKKKKRELEKQLERNESWLNDKNLDELFPSKIFIACAQDLEGMDEKSFKFHNNDLDFDLSNNIRHKIETKKEGDVSDVEISGNEIEISINGPNYSYELLTDAFVIKKTKESTDLRVKAYMKTYKKDEESTKLH